jgi:hypothetical protein
MTTHVAGSVPVHTSIESFKVMLMRRVAIPLPPTAAILVAVVYHGHSLGLLNLHLVKQWYWGNGSEWAIWWTWRWNSGHTRRRIGDWNGHRCTLASGRWTSIDNVTLVPRWALATMLLG